MASFSPDPNLSLPHSHAKNALVVPMGLSFGPTSVSNWFFIGKDLYLTSIPCDELYQSFFQDRLSKTVQCNLERRPSEDLSAVAISSSTDPDKAGGLADVFTHHITSVVRVGMEALDSDPGFNFKVMAIAVPDHWDHSARGQMELAVKSAVHRLDESNMVIPLSQAVHSSYEMEERTEGRHLNLILEYNKIYLHMMLVLVDGKSCDMESQAYFPHLGEYQLHKAPVEGDNEPTSEGTPIDDDFHIQRPVCHNKAVHFKPIIETVSEFMILMQKEVAPSPSGKGKSPTPVDSPSDATHPIRDVISIVVCGEACNSGLGDLRNALKERFVDEEGITVEEDWRRCGPYGAAKVAAQRLLQKPQLLGKL